MTPRGQFSMARDTRPRGISSTHRDRCLYLGRAIRDRPRWLEQNPHAWVRISDIQKEAETSPPVPVKGEDDVKAALSSRLPSSKARNVGRKMGTSPPG